MICILYYGNIYWSQYIVNRMDEKFEQDFLPKRKFLHKKISLMKFYIYHYVLDNLKLYIYSILDNIFLML